MRAEVQVGSQEARVLLSDGWHQIRWEGKERDLMQPVLACEMHFDGYWRQVHLYTAHVIASMRGFAGTIEHGSDRQGPEGSR